MSDLIEWIKDYMRDNIEDHIEPLTGEANTTAMAEDAINELAGENWDVWHKEWHPVWDCAVDVAEELGAEVRI